MPKIELKVTHTHAGVAYPAGHVIDVDEHSARWLIERGIGALVAKPTDLSPHATDVQQTHAAQAKSRHRPAKE